MLLDDHRSGDQELFRQFVDLFNTMNEDFAMEPDRYQRGPHWEAD